MNQFGHKPLPPGVAPSDQKNTRKSMSITRRRGFLCSSSCDETLLCMWLMKNFGASSWGDNGLLRHWLNGSNWSTISHSVRNEAICLPPFPEFCRPRASQRASLLEGLQLGELRARWLTPSGFRRQLQIIRFCEAWRTWKFLLDVYKTLLSAAGTPCPAADPDGTNFILRLQNVPSNSCHNASSVSPGHDRGYPIAGSRRRILHPEATLRSGTTVSVDAIHRPTCGDASMYRTCGRSPNFMNY